MRIYHPKSQMLIGLDEGQIIAGDLGLEYDKRFEWVSRPDPVPAAGNVNPDDPSAKRFILGVDTGYMVI